MYDVFISYARNDKPRAAKFQHAIKRCGWTVWWDADLLPGQQWNDEIERELRAAGAVVVLWSTDSVKSQFVCDEATIARELGKLVPVTLDGQRPKVGMGQLQLENMSEWDGIDSEHPGLIRVLQGIRHITKTGHIPTPAPVSAHAPAPASAPIVQNGGPQKSNSKVAIAGAAVAVVVLAAAGIVALPYLKTSSEAPPKEESRVVSPPPVEPAPHTKDDKTSPEKPKTREPNRPPDVKRPVETKPLVPAPAPEAAAASATAAATADRGCASLIAATRKRPDVSEGFFDLGKCHYTEGRFNDSVIAYNAAIELNANLPKYFEARGLAKWKNNSAPQGIADLNSAIDIKANDASLYESRGQIRLAMRDWQGAMDDYYKATRLNAKSKRAWLGYAEAAEKNGDSEIAASAKIQAEAIP